MNWQEWHSYAKDEKNWQNNDERGLPKAEYLHDFVLRLWFEEEMDVSIYELDFRPLFVDDNPSGVFESLRNPARFQHVEGDYALVWLNPKTGEYDEEAIDIAPESIRFFCERYGHKVKTASNRASGELVPA